MLDKVLVFTRAGDTKYDEHLEIHFAFELEKDNQI